jgi:hypothetical protein
MEDLIWENPEKFLNEPLRQFQRQPVSGVGRADLIFLDRLDRILVIELKRGVLERGAVPQLVDYFGMLKSRFPDKSIELMIVANSIPPERRVSCEQFHIEPMEIPQKKFRDIAEEVGYVFASEAAKHDTLTRMASDLAAFRLTTADAADSHNEFMHAPSKTEKSWHFWRGSDKRGYFLAFVNAKGSCSMRRFESDQGTFLGREYKSGDYQSQFSEYLKSGSPLHLSRQPNLERDCKLRLPNFVLSQLQSQVL